MALQEIAASQGSHDGTDAGGLQLNTVLPTIRLFTTAMKALGDSQIPPPNGAVFTITNEFCRNVRPLLSRPPPLIREVLN